MRFGLLSATWCLCTQIPDFDSGVAVCPTNYSIGDACDSSCPDYETCGVHGLSTISCQAGVCGAHDPACQPAPQPALVCIYMY